MAVASAVPFGVQPAVGPPAAAFGDLRRTLESAYGGEDLAPPDVERVFRRLVAGVLDPLHLAALLVALKIKGETGGEIAAAARVLRAAARPFPRPRYLFADCCGTGGDGAATLNISSGVALVSAACGLPVAKHGNRSVSSRCGSADVFAELGVATRLTPVQARASLDATGVAFLFAPDYHPAVAYAMPVRRTLGTRTLFNALGPLLSPAHPGCQLVGVYAEKLVEPVAVGLSRVGVRRALVVHGSGLDELAMHGPSLAARVTGRRIEMLRLTPEDAGLPRYPLEALAGGEPADNAQALLAVLRNEGKPAYRDAIAFNAGALLWVAGRSASLADGVCRALQAIADGRAHGVLQRLQARAAHA